MINQTETNLPPAPENPNVTGRSVDPRSPLESPAPPNLNAPTNIYVYIAATMFMMLIGVVAIVVITLARPTSDNATLYTVVTGFLLTTLTSTLAFIKSNENSQAIKQTSGTLQQVHLSINSRFDKFAEQIQQSAHAEGMREAEDNQRKAEEVKVEAVRVQEATAATEKNIVDTIATGFQNIIPPPVVLPAEVSHMEVQAEEVHIMPKESDKSKELS